MKHAFKLRHLLMASTAASVAAILFGCASRPVPVVSAPPAPVPAAPPPPAPVPLIAPPIVEALPKASRATDARAYRRDAAAHLYEQNAHRIFLGKMPPLLYAIGVLEVELDRGGHVTQLHWMRAPKHAPEVIAEIERTVRVAAPYPAPVRMDHVTYTDTWLWDKSGRFQLDTLTEGQL